MSKFEFVPPPFDKLVIKSKGTQMSEEHNIFSRKSIRVLTTPVLVREGRLIFQSVEVEINAVPQNHKEISVYFDPDREPKYSRFMGGRGWCSPPWDKIDEAERNGADMPYTVVVCKCQKDSTEEDIPHLQEFGHTTSCNLFHTISHVESLPAVPSHVPEVRKSPEKPQELIPRGGLPSEHVEGVKQFLEGSEGSIAEAMATLHIPSANVDESVVVKQLEKSYSFTTCLTCNNWGEVASMAQPKCINCSITGQ